MSSSGQASPPAGPWDRDLRPVGGRHGGDCVDAVGAAVSSAGSPVNHDASVVAAARGGELCVVPADSRTRRPAADRLSGPLTHPESDGGGQVLDRVDVVAQSRPEAMSGVEFGEAVEAVQRSGICARSGSVWSVRVAHEQRGAGTATVGDERLTMR